MNEITELRKWLAGQKGSFSAIADETDLTLAWLWKFSSNRCPPHPSYARVQKLMAYRNRHADSGANDE